MKSATVNLLDTPLPHLLAAFDVELVESSITDRGFFGALVERRDGGWVLSMPVGRPELERDTAARMLLGEVFGLSLSPVPDQIEVAVL
ncbi:hypothetical protein OG411_29870 [Streptomyces pseudogriseolus]|uniref:hypothetical protein n=1 Tax=Streptomyces pseudogriseolus TaxID=36817 RepID=UPI003254DAFC